ncbi:uroporphyrinogen-III synthase [Paramuricea clavata]|uniref:Uroporphyrinogen-III synthase n=1 Tax=Paramuricea clavata TaxID=317549 RepID=A0A7D9HAX8_PARCT|nr:uroporphyrinogen-III synthase [Paramuricea clavata]
MADSNDLKKPVVLILKSKNKDDSYERLFNEHGYKPVFVPVLAFKFINQADLRKRLENPENHSGLVFTSQRAVEAVNLCIRDMAFEEEWSSSLKEKWSQLPVFVTGKATGKQVREKLQFSPIFGEDSGSAEALAETILNKRPADLSKELLFPCANIKKEILPNILKEKGYGICCITAYCTQRDPQLVESLRKLFEENKARLSSPTSATPSEIIGEISAGETSNNPVEVLETSGGTSELLGQTSELQGREEVSNALGQLACIVFFSPSGVNFAHDALQQTIRSFEDIKLVAIGQSTAQELHKHSLTVAGVPAKPDPPSLLKVIDSILEKGLKI